KAEAQRRGLGASVRFAGKVPRRDVPRYLAAADVSLAPYPAESLDISRSPTKVLESLGMAVPVVANAEIPDQYAVVTQSGGGRCVPYDAAAFAAATVELLRSPEASRAAGAAGRSWVAANRSYESLADQVEAHYARLLGREPIKGH